MFFKEENDSNIVTSNITLSGYKSKHVTATADEANKNLRAAYSDLLTRITHKWEPLVMKKD